MNSTAARQRQFTSLEEALEAFDIPGESREVIRAITSRIGIVAYYGTADYIKAIRAGEGPALNIAAGQTDGFATEAEALDAAAPLTQAWASERGSGVWGVTHEPPDPAQGPPEQLLAGDQPEPDPTAGPVEPDPTGDPADQHPTGDQPEPDPTAGPSGDPAPEQAGPPVPGPRASAASRFCPVHFLELSVTGLCAACE